jgi:hypothetical protein
MYFRLHGKTTIILMSLRPDAPYADRIEENGKVLIYEGHDVLRRAGVNPKAIDQPMHNDSGTLSENGRFFEAARKHVAGERQAESVRVYEKIRPGVWVYNGSFRLVDARLEYSGRRKVFRFRLELSDADTGVDAGPDYLDHNRLIPTAVKLQVWKRDKAQCVQCGSNDNLHFDHIIPFSKGGSSLVAENIQLLCARHNIRKKDNIE